MTIQIAVSSNEMMIGLADKIVVGYASYGGQLETLLKNKNVNYDKI
jgi:hypothetical protein